MITNIFKPRAGVRFPLFSVDADTGKPVAAFIVLDVEKKTVTAIPGRPGTELKRSEMRFPIDPRITSKQITRMIDGNDLWLHAIALDAQVQPEGSEYRILFSDRMIEVVRDFQKFNGLYFPEIDSECIDDQMS